MRDEPTRRSKDCRGHAVGAERCSPERLWRVRGQHTLNRGLMRECYRACRRSSAPASRSHSCAESLGRRRCLRSESRVSPGDQLRVRLHQIRCMRTLNRRFREAHSAPKSDVAIPRPASAERQTGAAARIPSVGPGDRADQRGERPPHRRKYRTISNRCGDEEKSYATMSRTPGLLRPLADPGTHPVQTEFNP